MGIHHLITGRNGHGKTLMLVAKYLAPMSKETVEYKGQQIERRMVVGGVRNLLVPHELMEVPELDPENFTDFWGQFERAAHQPPVDWVVPGKDPQIGWGEMPEGAQPVVCSILNWWLWVKPGDVVVVDEAQRVYRPMPSGRRVPRFLARAETARHYGAQFMYLTQHPELLHKNLRNLIGPHEHVERMLGTSRVMVYEWPGCSHPDRKAKATKGTWKHDKKAFGQYASAELHTKFSERIPFAVYALGIGVVALGFLLWYLKGSFQKLYAPPKPAVAQQAKPATTQTGSAAKTPGQTGSVKPAAVSTALAVAPPDPVREPYAGRALHLDGMWTRGKKTVAYFGVSINGARVATLTLADLIGAGYSWTPLAPCAGVLEFRGLERVVTCDTPATPLPSSRPAQAEQGHEV